MKFVVFNGSPKGEVSVTMQYVKFIQKKFLQHEFIVFPVAQNIKTIENDSQVLQEIISSVSAADGVLWAFPLYYCLVHSDYKRFIELLTDRVATEVFAGKHAAILTTSIKFFDHTAHNYMHGICEDLGMKVYGSFSAEMNDLFKVEYQKKLEIFCQGFCNAVRRDAPTNKVYPPIVWQSREYNPAISDFIIDNGGCKVTIVTDADYKDTSLLKMVDKLAASFKQTEIINLRDVDISGGCLGCMHCTYDNTCLYQDGFVSFFDALKASDILVFAGAIRDRYLSALWKSFFDRSFYNNHVPSFSGKQLAFLVSGPLSLLPNLRQILENYGESQRANLAGIVTDEESESAVTDSLLEELAHCCFENVNNGYVKPSSFFSVAGHKIFRDMIWTMRFPFVADHRYYSNNGFYDFPQQDYSASVRNLFMGLLIKIPFIRSQIYTRQMKKQMVAPYKKLLAKL